MKKLGLEVLGTAYHHDVEYDSLSSVLNSVHFAKIIPMLKKFQKVTVPPVFIQFQPNFMENMGKYRLSLCFVCCILFVWLVWLFFVCLFVCF